MERTKVNLDFNQGASETVICLLKHSHQEGNCSAGDGQTACRPFTLSSRLPVLCHCVVTDKQKDTLIFKSPSSKEHVNGKRGHKVSHFFSSFNSVLGFLIFCGSKYIKI